MKLLLHQPVISGFVQVDVVIVLFILRGGLISLVVEGSALRLDMYVCGGRPTGCGDYLNKYVNICAFRRSKIYPINKWP